MLRILLVLMVLLATGQAVPAAEELPVTGIAFAPGIELPVDANTALVQVACTSCHDLQGLPAYRNYWRRPQWLAMVQTMIEHGAQLDQQQAARVADYLATYFGPDGN